MPENDFTSASSGAGFDTPPRSTDFTPAAPLKDAGVEFSAERGASGGGGSGAGLSTANVKQQVSDTAGNLQQQAGTKIREFADMGKERAGGALDQLAQMLNDAAGQVDGKLGAQYGTYARNAAETVQGLSQQVREQDLDALLDNARGLVRKSPAIAIGAAAALGFVLSRLVQSGIDADQA